jgi:hypothetical protein
MEFRNPTQHRMTRRAMVHDYTRPGIYHITMHVADSLGQPFGVVVGNLSASDNSNDAPRTKLTRVGQMVEHELLTAIHSHYPMTSIQDYVIMPEHLHCLMVVNDHIISKNGRKTSLGQVIAGFKKGCNKHYWEMTNQQGEPVDTVSSVSPASSVPSGFPAGYKVPSSGTTGRQPLFASGYCDVMPIDAEQLATQRAYIKGNPRSRLLRMSNRENLTTQRAAITTALTPAALRCYLLRECPPSIANDDALSQIQCRLLQAGGFITCDSYGNRTLLTERRCLPVICHRRDARLFETQKQHCLEAAAQGAVLVSACISPREREIITESVNHGFPVITIHDNGFADRYHPSTERLEICSSGRLLIVSPWKYEYRGKNEQVTVPFCKAMNCVAQALCHQKDDWWKNNE